MRGGGVKVWMGSLVRPCGGDGKFTAAKTANPSAGIAYKQAVKLHQHAVTLAVFMFGRMATLSTSEFCGECEKLCGFLRA